MSTSQAQISKMIDPTSTLRVLDAKAEEKTPLDTGKPAYERLANKLQENFDVKFVIVAKT